MKRAVAALVMLGIATSAAPSMAATVYGSAQLNYTVNATASLSLSTNYTAGGAGVQNAAAASILSNPAGNCSAGAAEATATLTFGGITPPAAGYTGCYYKNAIAVGILSNDGLGVDVYEYTDTIAAGTQICVFTPTTVTPATTVAGSGVAAAPNPYAAACPAVAGDTATLLTAQGAATAGTGFGAAGAPGGTDVTATPTATTAGAVGFHWYNGNANSGATWKFIGEDLQFNVSGTAVSGAASNVITVAMIPK